MRIDARPPRRDYKQAARIAFHLDALRLALGLPDTVEILDIRRSAERSETWEMTISGPMLPIVNQGDTILFITPSIEGRSGLVWRLDPASPNPMLHTPIGSGGFNGA